MFFHIDVSRKRLERFREIKTGSSLVEDISGWLDHELITAVNAVLGDLVMHPIGSVGGYDNIPSRGGVAARRNVAESLIEAEHV